MREQFTFAVVGHDEADTLSLPLRLAFEAAEEGDRVWFVDSASTDSSASIARSLGADVIHAPIGKGAAMATAIDRCDGGYICFLDADFQHSDTNIAATLRDTAADTGADMVVADYQEPDRRHAVTPTIYARLASALFPELTDDPIVPPLSGFRAIRAGFPLGDLPLGYGVEAHLNVSVILAGGTVANPAVGCFRGKLRNYANVPDIGTDVGAALLDAAERAGRLVPSERPAWNAWVEQIVEVLRAQPPHGADDTTYMERLLGAAERPLPAPGEGANGVQGTR